MSRPTVTRAALRRAIGLHLEMPFYQIFGEGSNLFTGGSSSVPQDTKLVQATGYWNNTWLMALSTGAANGEVRKVSTFVNSSGGQLITLDRSISQTPPAASSDPAISYELTTVFSPHEIHSAINRAIKSAFPAFFDVVEDDSLVICTDKMTYDLTGLTTDIYTPLRVWLETSNSNLSGNVVSSGDTTAVLPDSVDLTSVDSNYYISIYEGTGAGQLRRVDSVLGQEVTVADEWTINPNTTSKFRVWNPESTGMDWYEIRGVRFSSTEYPNFMRLVGTYSGNEGLRIRIQYVAEPAALFADSDTTIVPEEYIIHKACAILFGNILNNNKADRDKWERSEARHLQMAEEFKQTNRWAIPSQSVWLAEDPAAYTRSDRGGPLGW